MSESATRARLARDEALVILTLGAAGAPTTAIVLTRDTARGVSLPPRAIIAPLAERYARVAMSGTEPIALSRQLGAALLQPIVDILPRSITRLAISPDGELYRVPFDALRLAGDHYAIERFEISLVSSATVAFMLDRMPSSARANGLVAIGDPSFEKQRVHLTRLQYSADEARLVGEYGVRSVVLTHDQATEAALRGLDWSGVGVVHFATHALVADDGPWSHRACAHAERSRRRVTDGARDRIAADSRRARRALSAANRSAARCLAAKDCGARRAVVRSGSACGRRDALADRRSRRRAVRRSLLCRDGRR